MLLRRLPLLTILSILAPPSLATSCTPTSYLPATYLCSDSNVAGSCQGCVAAGPPECAELCTATPGCLAWTLLLATDQCWLKTTDSCQGHSEDWLSGYSCADGQYPPY